MTKAEERALEAYPVKMVNGPSVSLDDVIDKLDEVIDCLNQLIVLHKINYKDDKQ